MASMGDLTFEYIEVLAHAYSLHNMDSFEITCQLDEAREEIDKLRAEIELVPEGRDQIRGALERLLREEREKVERLDQERVRAAAAHDLKREEFKQQTAAFREYHASRGGFNYVFTHASEALAVGTMCKFKDHPGSITADSRSERVFRRNAGVLSRVSVISWESLFTRRAAVVFLVQGGYYFTRSL